MRTIPKLAVLSLFLLPALANAGEVAGWFLAGNDPASYVIDRDTQVKHNASNSARMASTRASKGFGTLMQQFEATNYAGKRMRFSGWVKANSVVDWAGLWMRVDDASSPPKTLAFDNMQSREIKGTKDWAKYEVVLDVAPEAKTVSFGILLSGEGTVWVSDLKFESVPTSVPVTSTLPMAPKPSPENLDFSR